MKLKLQNLPRSAARRIAAARSLAAFTMVEIALSLAVIGFALVAIIGVLPAGMSVQKDNREETIINFDAAYLMDTLRSGAGNQFLQGSYDLTNYILAITNIVTLCNPNGVQQSASITNWFTTTNYSINGTVTSGNILTNSAIIVGLLGTPKYILTTNGTGVATGFISNSVTADFRAITGNAMDHGVSQASKDFAWSYRVFCEIVPSADSPYIAMNTTSNNWNQPPDWVNFSAPGFNSAGATNLVPLSPTDFTHLNDMQIAKNLQANLTQIRLRFRWPILPSGNFGGGRQVFRTIASGAITNVQTVPPLSLYYILPQFYQGATP